MATLDTTPAADSNTASKTTRGFRLVGTVSDFKSGNTQPKAGKQSKPFISFMIDGTTPTGKTMQRRVTGFGAKAIGWLDVQPGATKVGIFVAYDEKAPGVLIPVGPYMSDEELAAKTAA
jgi:hypothetical protein